MERWGEQKGRGRGALVEPGRRGPQRDGFTDRWVGGPGEEPSPAPRPPRMEKWGPEGALPSLESLHPSSRQLLSEMSRPLRD